MTQHEFHQLPAADRLQLAQGRLLTEYKQKLLLIGEPLEQQRRTINESWLGVGKASLMMFPNPDSSDQFIVCFRDWQASGIFIARAPVTETEKLTLAPFIKE